jgi:hypothetical protein
VSAATIDVGPLYPVFRWRLLTFRPASGASSLAEALSGGLNDVTDAFPRGAFRIYNVRRRRGADAPFFTGELELKLFHRPRTQEIALEELADVANEALAGWYDLAAGVFEVLPRDRDTEPRFSERADPEVVENVSTFDLLLFPAPA